jgi:UDP-N-acetylmuramate--alanine ligase
MIAHILLEAGLDPFVSVGARVHELGMKNARSGNGTLAVVEADEYDRSFLSLKPIIAVLTTLEAEHLDIYKDIQDLQNTFITFVNQSADVTERGFVIINIDEQPLREILGRLNKHIVTFGISSLEAKYRATDIQAHGFGMSAVIHHGADILGELTLRVSGEHNIKNALAAIAAAEILGIPYEISRKALATFIGAERRGDVIGEVNGVLVIDDYAHHPTEVRATITALRQGHPGRRIVAVFQPHTFTRTRDFAKEFGEVFAECADVLILLDVYPAREQPIEGVTSELIFNAAHSAGLKECTVIPSIEELTKAVLAIVKKDDIVITLGTGSITEAAPKILDLVKEEHSAAKEKASIRNTLRSNSEKVA